MMAVFNVLWSLVTWRSAHVSPAFGPGQCSAVLSLFQLLILYRIVNTDCNKRGGGIIVKVLHKDDVEILWKQYCMVCFGCSVNEWFSDETSWTNDIRTELRGRMIFGWDFCGRMIFGWYLVEIFSDSTFVTSHVRMVLGGQGIDLYFRWCGSARLSWMHGHSWNMQTVV